MTRTSRKRRQQKMYTKQNAKSRSRFKFEWRSQYGHQPNLTDYNWSRRGQVSNWIELEHNPPRKSILVLFQESTEDAVQDIISLHITSHHIGIRQHVLSLSKLSLALHYYLILTTTLCRLRGFMSCAQVTTVARPSTCSCSYS